MRLAINHLRRKNIILKTLNGDEYAVKSLVILQSSHIILFDGLFHIIH